MTRSIGGRLNLDALALLHGRDTQPAPDRDTARVAALELARRGLTPRDIAGALRLSESAVRALLEGPTA